MSKENIDVICKVLLNFLLWSVLAAAFHLSKGLGLPVALDISNIFKGAIEHFPVIATIGAAVSLILLIWAIATQIRAKRAHRNELIGELVGECGSVLTSFGSVTFFVAATNWSLFLVVIVFWLLGGLCFRLSMHLGA